MIIDENKTHYLAEDKVTFCLKTVIDMEVSNKHIEHDNKKLM